MLGLITDRSQSNVDRRNALAKKGWANMTPEEQAEWSGNPLLADGSVNLLPLGDNYADGSSVKYGSDSITVISEWDGSYIYAILAVGSAADFAGKTMTLSLDSYYSSGGGTPNIVLYWHDGNGYEYAGGGLSDAGSMTFTLTENTNNRANLAMYLYATTDTAISAGAYVRYERLMLELGSTQHPYVPYYAMLPTAATKGAYNYSDLNRVEMAMQILSEELSLNLVTKTDWNLWDIPKQADMDRVIQNLRTIRKAGVGLPKTPDAPASMSKLSYTTANEIETILSDVDEALPARLWCGDIYAGEV